MIEQIASRLKTLRQAFDYSGAYVADQIGYSPNQLWQIEKGNCIPKIDFIAKVCTVYGISIDFLVFGSDEDFQNHINELFKHDMDAELVAVMVQQGYGRANTRWHR